MPQKGDERISYSKFIYLDVCRNKSRCTVSRVGIQGPHPQSSFPNCVQACVFRAVVLMRTIVFRGEWLGVSGVEVRPEDHRDETPTLAGSRVGFVLLAMKTAHLLKGRQLVRTQPVSGADHPSSERMGHCCMMQLSTFVGARDAMLRLFASPIELDEPS